MSVSLDFHLIIEVYYSIIWSPFSLLQKFAMLFFADIFNVLSDMKYCVHVCVCVCVCMERKNRDSPVGKESACNAGDPC